MADVNWTPTTPSAAADSFTYSYVPVRVAGAASDGSQDHFAQVAIGDILLALNPSLALKVNTLDLASASGSDGVGVKLSSAAIVRSLSDSLRDMHFLRAYATDASLAAGASSYIQAAVNEISAAGGDELILPPIELYANARVLMPANVTLRGVTNSEDFLGGTRFYRDNASITPFEWPLGIFGGGMRDIGFAESQPNIAHGQANGTPGSGWTPNVFPAWIQATGPGGNFKNLLFRGCYAGLKLGNTPNFNTGRVIIEDLRGQFFGTAAELSDVQDTCYIRSPHIYPYVLNDNNTVGYQQANSIAFLMERADNCNFVGGFIGGVKRGFDFESNAAGSTAKVLISNFDIDFSREAFYVGTSNGRYFLDNITCQPNGTLTMSDSRLIEYAASTSGNVVSFRGAVEHTGSEVALVAGTNNTFLCSASFFSSWNEAANGSACFNIGSGNVVKNSSPAFKNAGGATISTGAGSYVEVGN